MGDGRRFELFATFIKNNFPKVKKIADVAGGKGHLQLALKKYGYSVTTFDKRKTRVNKTKFEYRFFNDKIKEEFDLIVGMHPDEATDVIIIEATKRKVPFAIVPCCVMPNEVIYWGQHCYKDWLEHLKRIAESKNYIVRESILKMNGRNIILIGTPKK
jgi:hypothetical protein